MKINIIYLIILIILLLFILYWMMLNKKEPFDVPVLNTNTGETDSPTTYVNPTPNAELGWGPFNNGLEGNITNSPNTIDSFQYFVKQGEAINNRKYHTNMMDYFK